MIRVLVVDDQRLMRDAIRAFLARTKTLQVIGEARNGQEAIHLSKELCPDVIVMDIGMPVLDGIAATKFIKSESPCPKILILTMQEGESVVRAAKEVGADGYLSKASGCVEVVGAVQALSDGHTCFTDFPF